jgi:hypothetical protein
VESIKWIIFSRECLLQYQIGQRIASSYTLDHRIFIGGDATHTHSPKAGQGMNISFLGTCQLVSNGYFVEAYMETAYFPDAHNWAWKINLIEKGLGNPSVLLPSYEYERRYVAQRLLSFGMFYCRRTPKVPNIILTRLRAFSQTPNTLDSSVVATQRHRSSQMTFQRRP